MGNPLLQSSSTLLGSIGTAKNLSFKPNQALATLGQVYSAIKAYEASLYKAKTSLLATLSSNETSLQLQQMRNNTLLQQTQMNNQNALQLQQMKINASLQQTQMNNQIEHERNMIMKQHYQIQDNINMQRFNKSLDIINKLLNQQKTNEGF